MRSWGGGASWRKEKIGTRTRRLRAESLRKNIGFEKSRIKKKVRGNNYV